MANFQRFSELVHQRFNEMSEHELYVVNISGDQLWGTYLASFPPGTNPMFRERTEHDCSCCRNFIRNLGNVVALVDGEIHTVWDYATTLEGDELVYGEVAYAMSHAVADLVASGDIAGVYRTKEPRYGLERNFEEIAGGMPLVWNHFHAKIAGKHLTANPERDAGQLNTNYNVFLRGLKELSSSALDTVRELIQSNALYRGEEHLPAVLEFSGIKASFDKLRHHPSEVQFAWRHLRSRAALFRNTVIGTLVTDLSEGVDLEVAVAKFEAKVAPTNYKRTSALVTPRMIEDAMKTIQSLGLEPSLERRHATLADVSINDVLWADNQAQKHMKGGIASILMSAVAERQLDNGKADDISWDDFKTFVMPDAKGIDVFLAGAHQSNLMSITAPVHAGAEDLFKWGNDFGWSYNGNITDSIKERVKKAGGNTGAALRVSLAWFNGDDLDIHAQCPEGHIYFANKGRILDVDMNAGGRTNSVDPVENLSWQSPRDGTYQILVNQFNKRGNENPGFTLEVESDGKVRQFSYKGSLANKVMMPCLTLVVRGGVIHQLAVVHDLVEGGTPQDVWGAKTESFLKVDTIMLSPNHWGDQGMGNKHVFFLSEQVKNPEPARGIYNEFLRADLEKHRKVFETLGGLTKCPVTEQQLSGLGFSSTRGDTVKVRVTSDKGTRLYNLKF